ncbi:MAG: FHA domain-containing protein [Pirellulaceae bacterium]
MPINAKLVVVGGEVKTAEIKLRLPSTIGRGRGCTIMLPQALVSRQHCEIFESGGNLMVRDLGSLNGTFVNNQKIAEPSPINSEELLSIGTVTFRVVFDAAGASSPPPGPGPVMKSTSQATTPAAVATTPVAKTIPADDNSEPLEIGEFNFEETMRPGSDTVSPALVTESSKTPSGPLVMPTIKFGEPVKKPAAAEKPAAAPMVAATTKPAAPVSAPAASFPVPSPPPTAATPPAPAPLAKLIVPAAAPPAPAKAPGITVPDTEEKAEEEDDFQDFLKSLGK